MQANRKNRCVSHNFACVLEFRSDQSEGSSSLSNADPQLNISPFTRLKLFKKQLCLSYFRILGRSPLLWPIQVDMVGFVTGHSPTCRRSYLPVLASGNNHTLSDTLRHKSFNVVYSLKASQPNSSIRRNPSTSLNSIFAPNSTSALCFPRTIGRIHG